MFTVVETPAFSKLCGDYWTEDERGAFAAWIATNPEAGMSFPDRVAAAKFGGFVQGQVNAAECESSITTNSRMDVSIYCSFMPRLLKTMSLQMFY